MTTPTNSVNIASVRWAPDNSVIITPQTEQTEFLNILSNCANWNGQAIAFNPDEAIRLAGGTQQLGNWSKKVASDPTALLEAALRSGPRRETTALRHLFEQTAKTHKLRDLTTDLLIEAKHITKNFDAITNRDDNNNELTQMVIVTKGFTDPSQPNGLTPLGMKRYQNTPAVLEAAIALEKFRIATHFPGAPKNMHTGSDATWRILPNGTQEIELKPGYLSRCGAREFLQKTTIPHERTFAGSLKILLPTGSNNLRNSVNNIHHILEELHQLDPNTHDPNWNPILNTSARELRDLTAVSQRSVVALRTPNNETVVYWHNSNTIVITTEENEERKTPDLVPPQLLQQLLQTARQHPSNTETHILLEATTRQLTVQSAMTK